MYINEYELIKIMLTDYGFLSDGYEDFSIYDFQKYFENNIDSVEEFVYDEVNMLFYLYVNYNHKKKVYLINLADEHKELLAEGKADEKILILMKLLRKVHIKKRKEEISKKAMTTGNSPTDSKELILYAEYLQDQLKETKAHLARDIRGVTSPIIFGSITLGSIFAYASSPNDSGALSFTIFTISYLAFIYSSSKHWFFYQTLRDVIKDYKE